MIVTLRKLPEALWKDYLCICHQEGRDAEDVTEELLKFALSNFEKTGKIVPQKEKHERNIIELPDNLRRLRKGN